MNEQKINKAVEFLDHGGVVIYPTDTLYGLGADATNPKAVEKVFRIKGRDTQKEISWTFADIDMLKQYARVTPENEDILRKYLPGKYTFILLGKKDQGTIGVRIPDHPVAIELTRRLGKPITATSANRAGLKPLNKLAGIKTLGADQILWVGPLLSLRPSTVVDLTLDPPKIIRRGAGQFNRSV